MIQYHDTHFHLDLCPSPEEMADMIEKAKIFTIAVTNSPSVFFYTQKIASEKKYIRAALGLHPELAAQRHHEVDKFIELCPLTKYIGEVGLDNLNKTPDDYKVQRKVFEKIVNECAMLGNKILTLHSRKATNDVLDIVTHKFPGKIIFHWYSGSLKDLEKAIESGYYFSVNYPMTQSESGKKIIKRIPREQILIESDGPFTVYAKNPCTPMISKLIVSQITEVKQGFSEDDWAPELIANNFKNLLA